MPVHSKGTYFIYCGRLSQEKGILTLINAWKRLDRQYSLKIVGDGLLYSQLEQIIRTEKIENINLLGHKSGQELIRLIKEASFVIVPSECIENNPMSIIEGYSFGKPVIASRVGGIPEIVTDNKTGFLFEMRQIDDLIGKIKCAYSLPLDKYLILSKNAWQFAQKNFTEEAHSKNLIKIYSEVINNYRKNVYS
jgi:glycosyltransferase involved in cell wall biosynthesis